MILGVARLREDVAEITFRLHLFVWQKYFQYLKQRFVDGTKVIELIDVW